MLRINLFLSKCNQYSLFVLTCIPRDIAIIRYIINYFKYFYGYFCVKMRHILLADFQDVLFFLNQLKSKRIVTSRAITRLQKQSRSNLRWLPMVLFSYNPIYRDQTLSARITRGMFVACYNKIFRIQS